jgi:uncharacterized membrane protein
MLFAGGGPPTVPQNKPREGGRINVKKEDKKIEYNSRKEFTLSILIAALYAALTVLLGSISFSALFQIRVSDALIPLSYNRRIGRAAVYGTALGAMISNIFSFYGPYDLLLGVLANFFASYAAYMFQERKGIMWKVLATVLSFTVVVFFIGFLLFNLIIGMPLESALLGISLGSFVSIVLLGMALLVALEKIYR